ncbi:MAG: hypothetical protein JO247_13655, partial [Chloroflexi bacterium]|nr:hypothetical protein [Chloroflexota bacterium]
ILSEADFGFRSAVQAQLPLELAFLQAIEVARAAEAAPAAAETPAPARSAARNPFAFGTGAGPAAARPTRAPAPAESAPPHAGSPTPPAPAAAPASLTEGSAPREAAGSVPPSAAPASAPPAAGAPRAAAGPVPQSEALEAPAAALAADAPPAEAYEPPKAPGPAELALKDGAAAEYAPAAGDVTVATFVECWQQVRQAVRAKGAKNLEALLISCTPVEFDGKTLTLEGPEFHTKEIQSKAENKRLTEEALSLVAGRPCYVKCVARPNQKKTDGPSGGGPLTAGQPETARPDDDDPLVRAALRMLNAGRVLENS